jgi:ubiquinone/menaquinone biosynthesis C-methylase UbiE
MHKGGIMKNLFPKKVMRMVSALFSIMLLHKVVPVKDQQTQGAIATQQKFNNDGAWIKAFEDPERDEWQKPDEVVKSLNLKPGDIIADIGAGTGYFTKRFAKAVSPGGQALGLDIVPSRVQHMKEEAQRLGLNNYKALLIKPDNPKLEPGSVDVVFLCNTYHHLENRVDYFQRLSKSLKENGRVVIVDFYKKPLPVGPSSADHKLSKEVVLEEFQVAGYHLKHDKDFLPYQYYLEFVL